MPQLRADQVDRRSFIRELEGVRVTKPVRVYTLLDSRPSCRTFQHSAHVLSRDRFASQASEYNLATIQAALRPLLEPSLN